MAKFVYDYKEIRNYATLDEIQKEITAIKSKYPESKDLHITAYLEYDFSSLKIEFRRPMTKEELDNEKADKQKALEWEREQYEKLRKKFEGKP